MSCIFFDSRSKIKDDITLNTEKFQNIGQSLELQIEYSIHNFINDSINCDGKYCFALWNLDSVNNTNVLIQGCWEHPDRPDCNAPECVARIPLNRRSMRNLTRFCCCHGYHCNKYMTDNVNMSLSMENNNAIKMENESKIFSENSSTILLICIMSTLLLSIFAGLSLFFCKRRSKSAPVSEKELFVAKNTNDEVGSLLDIGMFVNWELISQGHYGNVLKAKYAKNNFAIKTYYENGKSYFLNELWMYEQPCLRHQNIVPFMGHFNMQSSTSSAECISGLNGAQFGLVLKLADLGSLVSLLKKETISWEILCSLARDIAAAINCLHSEYTYKGELKRIIVHRDINSRNILITSTMCAQLCDFGFAAEVGLPNKSYLPINPPILPTDSNVGTIRYMAPEILEGCVNLGENRVSLKQVDIYAFALVLWEMTTRCHNLHSNVGELLLAYEKELGEHPSREQLRNLVSIAKVRPRLSCDLPHQGFHILEQTIEECWDDDAEARLSSTTILHRIHKLNKPFTLQQTILQKNNIEPNTQLQPIIDEGTEDCLSSTSSQSPISDISNSLSMTTEMATTDVFIDKITEHVNTLENEEEKLHRVATVTKSDGNSSGIGGLSGDSTLSFDRPPLLNKSSNNYNQNYYLQHNPSDYNTQDSLDINEYYSNNHTFDHLNPSLVTELPYLVLIDNFSGSKIKDYKKTHICNRIKNWFNKK